MVCKNVPLTVQRIIKRLGGKLNENLTLVFTIQCKMLQKNHHMRKYLSCLGRYIHRIYRIKPNFHISWSVLTKEPFKCCS